MSKDKNKIKDKHKHKEDMEAWLMPGVTLLFILVVLGVCGLVYFFRL